MTPYYNKANQAGLIAHFTAVADTVSLPMILYHVPSRTGCKLMPQTCAALSAHPRIVGLKDAGGDIGFTLRVRALCGDGLPIYAGNDDMTVPILALGGCGVISVVSNLLPAEVAEMCRAYDTGNIERARRIQAHIAPLCDLLFTDVNPIPVKCTMEQCGLCRGALRLPLTEAYAFLQDKIRSALSAYSAEL